MSEKKETALQRAKREQSPKMPLNRGKLSSYIPKDEIFTKEKQYIEKNQVKSFIAEWYHLGFTGKTVTLYKGQNVSEAELAFIPDHVRKEYLVKTRKTEKVVKTEN